MTGGSRKPTRGLFALFFLALLAVGLRYSAVRANAADQSELQRYREDLAFARALSSGANRILNESELRDLRDAALRLQYSLNYWNESPDLAGPIADQARRECSRADNQVYRLLNNSSQVERVWAGSGSPRVIARRWPFGGGVVLLRVSRGDAADPTSRLVRAQVDLSRAGEAAADLPNAATTYVALFFTHVPQGEKHIPIVLRAASTEIARIELAVATPGTRMAPPQAE